MLFTAWCHSNPITPTVEFELKVARDSLALDSKPFSGIYHNFTVLSFELVARISGMKGEKCISVI
jgi:hypothetical protein